METPYASRLDRLLALRARLDVEIREERERARRVRANIDANFAALQRNQRREARQRLEAKRPEARVVREWAQEHPGLLPDGVSVGARGRLQDEVYSAYEFHHSGKAFPL